MGGHEDQIAAVLTGRLQDRLIDHGVHRGGTSGSDALRAGLGLGLRQHRFGVLRVGLVELLAQERIEHQTFAIEGHVRAAIEAGLHVEEGDLGTDFTGHLQGLIHRQLGEL